MVIEEHALSRESIGLLLSRALPEAVVLEVSSVKDGLLVDACGVSLILFGLRPPYMKRLDTILELRRRLPLAPLIVLSHTEDIKIAALARARGACGLLHTSDDTEDLLAVIRRALVGKSGFPGARDEFERTTLRLSPRQTEVFNLLSLGKSNKEISAALSVSGNTVRTHIAAIFNILGVSNRTEAVIQGRDWVM